MHRPSKGESLLTRHPRPHDTESLAKHFLKLTEVNGFESPRTLLEVAGLGWDLDTGLDVSKLARITGWKAELEKISYRSLGTGSRTTRLLGHELGERDLRLHPDKICPQCIAEMGFAEAHFDLAIMVACPVHKCMLVERCRDCDSR